MKAKVKAIKQKLAAMQAIKSMPKWMDDTVNPGGLTKTYVTFGKIG
jgi:hypothetical protein